jgi:hypothetical protein
LHGVDAEGSRLRGYEAKRLRGRRERGSTRIREQKGKHEIDG